MSAGKVDVLAVMDRSTAVLTAIANGYSGNAEDRKAADEAGAARAAVAELIAANVEAATAKRVLEQDFKPGARVDACDPRVLRHIAAEERLTAALAQVQP